MRERAAAAGLDVPVVEVDIGDVLDAFGTALPVVALRARVRATPGRAAVESAPAVIESIERCVEDVRHGRARAVVTAPIMKDVLYRAGFAHPGHTEFLGELAGRLWGRPVVPVMMIWSSVVAVVPVTVHIPLSEVPRSLDEGLIVRTAGIVAHDLRTRFGIAAPRLAVAGLNPHAGENGALGHEDERIIAPAVARLRTAGIDARRPACPPTPCSMSARAGPMTSRSACITTRPWRPPRPSLSTRPST